MATATGCKSQLDREGITYDVVDIERDPTAADVVMAANNGNQTVPTLVYTDGSAHTNPSLRPGQGEAGSDRLTGHLRAGHDACVSPSLDDVSWPVRTRRLTLRRSTPQDADATWSYRRDPAVAEWMTRLPASREEYDEWYVSPAVHATRVVVEHEGTVVGELHLEVKSGWAQAEVSDLAAGTEAEIGYVLDPAHQGQGFGTEAGETYHCRTPPGWRATGSSIRRPPGRGGRTRWRPRPGASTGAASADGSGRARRRHRGGAHAGIMPAPRGDRSGDLGQTAP